jgi:hypothetical protein
VKIRNKNNGAMAMKGKVGIAAVKMTERNNIQIHTM